LTISEAAVLALSAKPIIDILIAVRSLADARTSFVEPLSNAHNSVLGRRIRSAGTRA
jgi:hypothetical protein